MSETITLLTKSQFPDVGSAPRMKRTESVRVVLKLERVHPDLEQLSDLDFVLALAYRGLEQEALGCRTEAAKKQVGHLLDRLTDLDWRTE